MLHTAPQPMTLDPRTVARTLGERVVVDSHRWRPIVHDDATLIHVVVDDAAYLARYGRIAPRRVREILADARKADR